MIEGVIVEELAQISDERGKVMHMLRRDSKNFKEFGEIYFSTVNKGCVKAWKKHRDMTQFIAVPVGKIKLVIFDPRPESVTKGRINEFDVGADNYVLIKIPRQLWYGFKGLSDPFSMIANCADMPHDPKEVEKLPPYDKSVPYSWT